ERPDRASRGGGGRRGAKSRPGPRPSAEGIHRRGRRLYAGRRAGARHLRIPAPNGGAVQARAADRILGAAEDDFGKDSPGGAAPGGSRPVRRVESTGILLMTG